MGNPSLTSCWFSGNSTCLMGGGLFCRGGNAVVTDCTFFANSATDLAYGGGAANELGSTTLQNCVFIANQAVRGGGFYNRDGNSTLGHCTFAEHSAPSGRAVACDSTGQPSNLDMANSILWDGGSEIWRGGGSTITITYSDVQGGWPGNGCLDSYPDFVRSPDPGLDGLWGTDDDDYGNLRLLPVSPCIHAGDPGFMPDPGQTDLDGHARLLCQRVDMGAYEFGIGDFNCDRDVDLTDFSSWPAHTTGPDNGPYAPGGEAFDFEYDSDVDLQDFAAFQQALGL
jgi:hypothetical protein